MNDDRVNELATKLARVEQRVQAACEAAGRSRADVKLIVVTKTYPATDVQLLSGLGVTDVGEARHPEAGRKVAECVAAGLHLTWHFVGAVQTNKAANIARYADLVHSVDRLRLVHALDAGAQRAERVLDCLVQLDLDPSDRGRTGQRSGTSIANLPAVLTAVAAADWLRLRGVMTVAPPRSDPAESFDRLSALAAEMTAEHPAADLVSAGMSDDLEQAVAAGATHLRVGRAVLGERPPLR